MPGPTNSLLLIEGPFEELTDELAQYIDQLKKSQGDASSSLQSEIEPLAKDDNKVEVLKKLVTASSVLNSAPEKGGWTA
jgi:translation initiation factor 3 subunit M